MIKQSKIYLIVIAFLISLLPKTQAQTELNGPTPWEVIGNPFSQPYVNVQIGKNRLDYYGSGDVNNDELINQEDGDEILGSNNDRADIDGDGAPGTQADKDKLTEFLNGNTEYLPGHWNELKTPEERISWLEKMISINDAISPGLGKGWVCANYITQMELEFYGISNVQEFVNLTNFGYEPENNARFNLPAYYFSTTNTNGVSHSVAGVLVGNDPLNFEDWYFVGYDHDDRVLPGNFNMDPNNPIEMYKTAYVESPITGERRFDFIGPLIKWSLNDGEATLETYLEPVLILENPNIIEVHVGGIPDTLQVVLNGLPFDYNCTPHNLFNLGYDAIPDTTKENTILPINLEHVDSDTTRFSERSYDFTRKFRAWIYSGGVTKEDSVFQRIAVKNVTNVKSIENLVPEEMKVYQNYPNPFNPSTTISFAIPFVETKHTPTVQLLVYDVLGIEVATLVNEEKSPGTYEISFSASDLPSGVYVYILKSGNFIQSKKMILLK